MENKLDFFKDEVRCGFYIPTIIKQAWSASLAVLAEIDRICVKYGITYFADWGTILGAVRHGGFVPWDDDLDICMKRQDYERFCQVADEELPVDFAIHDFRRKENNWLFLARVVNKNHICFDEAHLKKYHNFPYIASVDIFVKDYLYRDEAKEKERCGEVLNIISVADKIVEGEMDSKTKENWLLEFERKYNVKIDKSLDNVHIGIELYGLAQTQMARTKTEESDRIEQIFPWGLKGAKGIPKEYYNDVVRLPFENTTIPVPAVYNEMLINRYGNYLKAIKVWDGHEYPYFEGQRSNLQSVADFELPEFKFDSKMLRENQESTEDTDSLRYFVGEYEKVIGEYTRKVCNNPTEDLELTLNLLAECQQMAVDLANLIEEVKGEDSSVGIAVVSSISWYCEALFELYKLLETGDYENAHIYSACEDINSSLEQVSNQIKIQILDRKQILFLAVDPVRWDSFRFIYDSYMECEDVDVTVLALPLLFKDVYGNIEASNEEILSASKTRDYPEYVKITDWTTYDLVLNRPDVIYIQDSYDGENSCLTIPPQFYSDRLQTVTKELIYVQPFKLAEFEEKDHCDWHNMKYYVTAPGVIRADKVLVQSEHMKQIYVKRLTMFAGEDTESVWESKVCAYGLYDNNQNKPSRRKRMVYCIGANEIMEHSGCLIAKVTEKMNIFEMNKDKISVSVVMYPANLLSDKGASGETIVRLQELLGKYENEEWCDIISYSDEEWQKASSVLVRESDAYYGSPSPLSNMFVNNHKPVMISSYELT